MAVDDDPHNAHHKRRRLYNVYRTGLLIFSSLYTFFFAGAFFGYGPMILLLQQDEAFVWKCNNKNGDGLPCPDQTGQLLNVHFVGTLTQIMTPFVGHLCDTRGPFATMLYTAATALLGVVILIFSRAIPMDDLLYPAFCFLGMNSFATSVMCVVTGGIYTVYENEVVVQAEPGMIEEVKISQEQESLGLTEKTRKGSNVDREIGEDDSKDDGQSGDEGKSPRRVIGLLNNLFDAGSVTYLIIWEAHKSLGISLQVLCYWYLGAGVLIFGGALACWKLVLKHKKQDKELQQESDQINRALKTEQQEALVEENQHDLPFQIDQSTVREEVEQENKKEWQQLCSTSYLWLVAFFAFHVARNIFTLTSAAAFLKNLGDRDDKYIAIFSVMMPASVFGFPFVDWALGKYGYHMALQVINMLGLAHGIIQISATGNLNVQIAGFLFFSFYRCFLFSVIFSYLAVLMPEKVLGKANGLLHISAGAASLLNIPLGNAAVQQWNGSFFIPNCVYTVGILPFFYAAYGTTAGIRSKQRRRRRDTGIGSTQHPSLLAMDDEVAKA